VHPQFIARKSDKPNFIINNKITLILNLSSKSFSTLMLAPYHLIRYIACLDFSSNDDGIVTDNELEIE